MEDKTEGTEEQTNEDSKMESEDEGEDFDGKPSMETEEGDKEENPDEKNEENGGSAQDEDLPQEPDGDKDKVGPQQKFLHGVYLNYFVTRRKLRAKKIPMVISNKQRQLRLRNPRIPQPKMRQQSRKRFAQPQVDVKFPDFVFCIFRMTTGEVRLARTRARKELLKRTRDTHLRPRRTAKWQLRHRIKSGSRNPGRERSLERRTILTFWVSILFNLTN